MNMMTTKGTFSFVRSAGLAIALLVGLSIPSEANAQYKPTGDDGITASPRVRQQLDERKARPAVITPAAHHACAKCKDTWVARRITEPKGIGARTQTGNTTLLVPKHLCEGCSTSWHVAGSGKAKRLVAKHKCTDSEAKSLACCAVTPAAAVR